MVNDSDTFDVRELTKQAAQSECKESYRVLIGARKYRISVGARARHASHSTVFFEVLIYMCSSAAKVDVHELERAVAFLKQLQARGYSLNCEDDYCISCEMTVPTKNASAEYERLASTATRVFQTPP